MKRKAITIVTLLACGAVILIGCGGGGGGGTSPAATTGATTATSTGSTTSSTTGSTTSSTTGTTTGGGSPFTGRWDGTSSQTTPADGGTVTLAVAGNGDTSGDVFDSDLNEEATVAGTMTNGGVINFTVKFASVTETWSGTLSINGQGHLVGTVTVSGNGSPTTMTLDLTLFATTTG